MSRRAALLSPLLTLGPLFSPAIFLLAPSPAAAKGGRRNLPVAAFSPHRITPRGNQYARLPRAFFPLSLSPSRVLSFAPSLARSLALASCRSRTNHPPFRSSLSHSLSPPFLSPTRSLALPLSRTPSFSLSPTLRLGHPRRPPALRPAMPLCLSSLPRARAHLSCSYTPLRRTLLKSGAPSLPRYHPWHSDGAPCMSVLVLSLSLSPRLEHEPRTELFLFAEGRRTK